MANTSGYSLIAAIMFITSGCDAQEQNPAMVRDTETNRSQPQTYITYEDSLAKSIHVFVALCDNKYQGIVPVPAKIGNGQDPDNNLYWGCAFGVRSYFKNSRDWKLLTSRKAEGIRLERLIFKHVAKNYYLIADAYNGQFIKNCTKDFLHSAAGQLKDTVQVGSDITIGINGNAALVAYIGHNGLMDFQLPDSFTNNDGKERDCIVLACISKKYFSSCLRNAQVKSLVWTTNLMAPEAYILHDALAGYTNKESGEQVRTRAAKAYARYQKCSERAARSLLVTGW